MPVTAQPFDLNIEQFLEEWTPAEALRELIANALDEQALTGSKEIDLWCDEAGAWHLRDWGRGLRYEHLTQKEDAEKHEQSDKVIGCFGVGLKDALATLHRWGIIVQLQSAHMDMKLATHPKAGFSDLTTLHAMIDDPSRPAMVGTEIILQGIEASQVERAKAYFLHFSDELMLGESRYGSILQRPADGPARIYVKGLRVAEEERFLFSYNITCITDSLRKGLNRERSHVGRSVYSPRIKQMLLSCDAPAVADLLVNDMARLETGEAYDEVGWLDVAVRASTLLQGAQKVLFATAQELRTRRDLIDDAERQGHRIITVNDKIRDRLGDQQDQTGQALQTLHVYQRLRAESFQFHFIPPEALSPAEQQRFEQRHAIAALVGGMPRAVREIKISETMRPDLHGDNTLGLWEAATGRIIIKRSELRSLPALASTLLHEIAHAQCGQPDLCREFEHTLTQMLGHLAAQLLQP